MLTSGSFTIRIKIYGTVVCSYVVTFELTTNILHDLPCQFITLHRRTFFFLNQHLSVKCLLRLESILISPNIDANTESVHIKYA